MKPKLLLAVGLVVVVTIAYLIVSSGQDSPAPPTESMETTITLNEYSESGQSGVATLIERNGMMEVTLELSGYETEVAQPAHIHSGNCPRIGPVIFELNDVVANQSTTVLETTLNELMSGNDTLNLNVHESYDNFSTYTACGDMK